MFSFLTPFALWLAPFIAAPLLIHLLGRVRPKLLDFPSLSPVKGILVRAMRRHRLKNWLQLLLRTLALASLVLAASDPVRRRPGGWNPPVSAGLLLHNGAYAACPFPGGTALESQQRLLRRLDSLTGGRGRAELLFPGASSQEPAARFGHYSDALTRLLRGKEPGGLHHLYVPVFDWMDLEETELLKRAWDDNPELRLVLIEFPKAREALSPFLDLHLAFPKDGIIALRARVAPLPPSGGREATRTALWTPEGGTPREIPFTDSLEILMALPPSGWLCGTLSLAGTAGEAFAYPAKPISIRVPPPATLCHVGNPLMSLASLGQGGLRLRVQSFPDSRGFTATGCDVLYLADPKNADAALLGRVAETVRRGGKAIIGIGRNADPALLNRNLLVPLGLGRLTALERREAVRIAPKTNSLSLLGWGTAHWGDPGTVTAQIALEPGPETAVLLSAGDLPVLAHRRVGAGAVLLWTTDPDDPEWTDIGLGPWVALAHQAFLSGSWADGIGLNHAASDSVLTLSAPEGSDFRILDPEGTPFPGLAADPGGRRAGPFDRLGLYRVVTRNDSERVAVSLAKNRGKGRWEEGRMRFLSGLGDYRDRVLLRDADDMTPLYGGTRFRLPMLLLAALLLLVEGVISLRLSPAPVARD